MQVETDLGVPNNETTRSSPNYGPFKPIKIHKYINQPHKFPLNWIAPKCLVSPLSLFFMMLKTSHFFLILDLFFKWKSRQRWNLKQRPIILCTRITLSTPWQLLAPSALMLLLKYSWKKHVFSSYRKFPIENSSRVKSFSHESFFWTILSGNSPYFHLKK